MPIIGVTASSAKGAPGIPTIGTVTDVGTGRAYNNGAATVPFTEGSGAAATSFTVKAYSSGGVYQEISATGFSSPITITGLLSNTEYKYRIYASNASGNSLESGFSNTVTATTVPQAPTVGTATGSNASATVTYTAGATGGKTVTAYTATSSPGSLTGTGTSPITVSGLSNGTAYTFTVTATNANGTSLNSAASNSVTPTAPPPPTTWTLRNTGFGSSGLMGITYGNNLYVASGQRLIITSTDTISWTLRSAVIGASRRIYSLEYGNGIFLGVGSYGIGIRSTNGITWVTNNPPSYVGASGDNGTTRIRYGNGVFMATGSASTSASYNILGMTTDGLTWSHVGANLPTTGGGGYGIAYGNNRWVISYIDSNTTYIASSTNNGTTWTSHVSWATNFAGTGDLAYGNGIFFMSNGENIGKARRSTDGITWTTITNATWTQRMRGLSYGNGNWVQISFSGNINQTSTDGITWTTITTGVTTWAGTRAEIVKYVGNLWMAVGGYGRVWTSPG